MSAINIYEEQLKQIEAALETCDNDVDRANLISLQSDLKELISLESESTPKNDSPDSSDTDSSDSSEEEDGKVELAKVRSDSGLASSSL